MKNNSRELMCYSTMTIGLLWLLSSTYIVPMSSRLTPAQRRIAVSKVVQSLKKKPLDLAYLPILRPVTQYIKNEIVKEAKISQIVLSGHSDEITSCAFNKNDGTVLVTSSKGIKDNIIIWNGLTGQKLKTISDPLGNVEQVFISPNGSKLVSISVSAKGGVKAEQKKSIQETISLWDIATEKKIGSFNILSENFATGIEFNSDEQRVIVFSYSKATTNNETQDIEQQVSLFIVDTNTGTMITKKDALDATNIIVSPNGNTMVTALEDELLLYDLTTGKIIKTLEGSNYPVKYSGNGTRILTRSYNNENYIADIFIWDSKTGDLLTKLNDVKSYYAALNFDGTKMVTEEYRESENANLCVWDVATQNKISILEYSANVDGWLNNLEFSPDSSMVLAAGSAIAHNNGVLFNAVTGEQIDVFGNYLQQKDAFFDGFSSDSKRIKLHITGEDNPNTDEQKACVMTLWDIDTRKQIGIFKAKHDLMDASPDFITTVSSDSENNHNFVLRTFISVQERTALTTMENDLAFEQVNFLLQLYRAKLSGTQASFIEDKRLLTLPENVQSLVKKYLLLEKVEESSISEQPEPIAVPAQVIQPEEKTWWQKLLRQ